MNITAEERFFRFSMVMESITKKLQKFKNAQMSPYGLHSMHVMFLCAPGKTSSGLTAGELSQSCGVDKAFISRTATDLRKKGLIELSAAEGSPRFYKKKMVLTDSGREIVERISGIVEDTVDRATMGISEEEFGVFYSVMEKLGGNLTNISGV